VLADLTLELLAACVLAGFAIEALALDVLLTIFSVLAGLTLSLLAL